MGLLFGAGLLFVTSYVACVRNTEFGERMIFGSLIFALTQFVPTIHLFTHSFGVAATESFGGAILGDALSFDSLTSVFGGFVYVVFTGCMLMMLSFALGWLILLFPGSIIKPLTKRYRIEV
ncbi:hypothetical protein SH528x_002937 [Novipirellula sp. SH528]|uniref:hypothetical protein n=1 Tax=Novipirellula sp. SH528 TaxID=3454466 RepID=UPI003F9F62FA